MASIEEVAGFISGKMTQNAVSDVAEKIRGYLAGPAFRRPLDFYKACQLWRARVNDRRPWDYKHEMRVNYGEYATDSVTGRAFNVDVWGNIHYGYVGRAAGFSGWTLKAGAGLNQRIKGNPSEGYWRRRAQRLGDADFLAAFDDPADQTAIETGADLWEKHGAGMHLANLLTTCRAAAARLNTK